MAGFHLRRKHAKNRPQQYSWAGLDGRASVPAVPTRPEIVHKGAFVPILAAHDVPKKHAQQYACPSFGRPQRTQKSYTTVPRRSPPGRDSAAGRPFAFLSDRTKADSGSRRRPLYPKTVRGAQRPRPPSWARSLQAGSHPYGQGRQSRSVHGPKIRQQNMGTLRPNRTRRQANRSGQLVTSRPPDPGFFRFERSPKVGRGPVRPSDLPGPSGPAVSAYGRPGRQNPSLTRIVQRLLRPRPRIASRLDSRVARHGTARHGTARHGTARHGTARRQKIQSTRSPACLPDPAPVPDSDSRTP